MAGKSPHQADILSLWLETVFSPAIRYLTKALIFDQMFNIKTTCTGKHNTLAPWTVSWL